MLACISGCRGVNGCIVATWLCPVREKVRPAWSDGGREREKVRPACSKCPEIGVLWRAGRTFSRLGMRGPVAGRTFSRKCRWKPRAGRVFSRVRLMERCARRSFLRLGMRRPVAGRSFSRASSRGGCWARAWRLDGGCVPPLDLGRATDTRSRMHLPSWLPVGASGRRPAIAFPQDSSHFAENATHPYI